MLRHNGKRLDFIELVREVQTEAYLANRLVVGRMSPSLFTFSLLVATLKGVDVCRCTRTEG